jgi:predicted cupin superfamily sugar epimerase
MDELQALIEELGLQPHPEGGFYKETFRSPELLSDRDRNLITAIYFILTSDNVSKFHRIVSDELWFFHAGSPITIHLLDHEYGHREIALGNEFNSGQVPQFCVPGGTIFGSSVDVLGSYALVSCVVAPGFDFADFELFDRETLLKEFPEQQSIIERLT